MKKLLFIAGAILAIILFPILNKNMYHLYLMNRALIHAILATGLVFLTGFAGQISLGQAGFYAIGAYSSAYFTVKLGMPIPVGIIIGIAISVLAGFLLSIPSFKLKAFFLSLVTIAFGQIVWMLVITSRRSREVLTVSLEFPSIRWETRCSPSARSSGFSELYSSSVFI
jgi:branched-chain amino acid transport system permease protein